MAGALRRPLFVGAVLELATETGAFRFSDVLRVTRLIREGAFGGDASSLCVADEEVRDWVCLGEGEWCLVGEEWCSGVTVSAVEGVGGADDSGAMSWGRLGTTATARVAVVVAEGKGAMVGGGEDVSGARMVVVSSTREPRTWEITMEVESNRSEERRVGKECRL